MKGLIAALMLVISTNAFSFTDCEVIPVRVWLNLSGSSISICFEESGCVNKVQDDETVTEAHLNRMYSTAMAAITADKALRIRYSEDGVCSDLTQLATDEILGLWFLK
jgi:hypothetical protein